MNLAVTRIALVAGLASWMPLRARAEDEDVVSRWNLIALEAGRQDMPLAQARALAMVHAAMFDAADAVDRKYGSYLVDARAADRVDGEAAAAAAAHAVLVALRPEQAATLNAALSAELARVASSELREPSIAFGRRVGEQVVSARAGDGSSGTSTHEPLAGIGRWQPTPPALAAALAPHWGTVRPFLLRDAKRFVPPPPPALTSQAYARDFAEVKRVGGRASAERTADQTAASAFWTAYAPHIWSAAARQALAQRPALSLVERARVFALMTGAMADAFVVGWAAKYEYSMWRPVTAIRAAAGDGNARTEADPTWEPLIATPPFPCYVSGHAISAGAASSVLAAALGTDRVSFTITNPEVGLTRRYGSFSELANEALEVRIWSGVHFRVSQTTGLQTGLRIGQAVMASRLLAVSGRRP